MIRSNYEYKDLEPAYMYLRKSREDQEAEARGEGETLAKHKKALFKLAKEYSVNITKIFEEIVSGESLIHRSEMLAVLKEVEEGNCRSVWCMDMDRLGRGNMQEQGLILETFKTAKVKIVTPRKIYDLNDEFDEEYSEFEAFMARKELKLITRRLQGGRIRSVSLDRNYIGTRPPYGYQIYKTANERTLVPDPVQAPAVKLIFELYTHDDINKRMGSGKLAKELNRLGFSTYFGKHWEPSTVLFIIKNAVYAGRLQWKKKEQKKSRTPGKKRDTRTRPRTEWIDVPGKHEPLVSMEMFLKAQKILKSKYHIPYQLENGITNPLAGLIKCDFCEASMVLRPYMKQKPHLMCYNSHCPNKSTRFEYVEREVLNGLRKWLEKYRAKWADYQESDLTNNNVIDIRRQALLNLRRDLKELEQQKDKLHDLLERGIYNEETYLERSRNLSERITSTREAISESEGNLIVESQKEHARRDIIPQVEKILELYDLTDGPAQKNALLKSVLEYATYRKEKYQRDDNFTLVLHPRLPK